MSGITERSMDNVERFMMMFMSAVVGEIYNLSQFSVGALTELFMKREDLKDLIDKGGEATLKEFQKALKKEETFSALRVNDSMVADYKRFMNDRSVLYVSLNDMESDTHTFMFRDRDLEKMKEIKELVNMIHMGETEIPAKTFVSAYENREVSRVTNLSAEEVELFRYFMKPEKALFSVMDSGNGTYLLAHDPKDKEIVKDALQKANWALRGNFGERVREQVQFRIKGRQDIIQDLEEAQMEYYLVSKSNPKNYVHVTENQVTLYKNEQEISKVYRNDTDFKPTALDMIESISAPTIFAAREFSENIGIRQDLVEKKVTLDEFPSEMIVEEEMKKYNRLRDLVSQKMGMDNENQGSWALYVDSVSYSEFNTYENILDDDHEIAAREREFERLKESVKETEQEHVYDDIKLEQRSVDYLIDHAQERVNQEHGKTETRQKERTTEYKR